MSFRYSTFKIFGEKELRKYLSSRLSSLESEVKKEPEDKLLNVGGRKYVNYLYRKYKIENIDLHFGDTYATSREEKIPAEKFPKGSFFVERGKKYDKNVIEFNIPFSGNKELLKCTPSSRMLWTIEVKVEDGCVCFDIIDFHEDADKINRRYDDNKSSIEKQLSNVRGEVKSFNNSLNDKARKVFEERKENLLDKNDLLSNLDVPVKKSGDVPDTFSVPSPDRKKRIQVEKPEVREEEFQPEPTLDTETFNQILEVIDDVGVQFERSPTTYRDKNEEDLRDHLLLFLEPNFEGSATGETFNRAGKTDILLRHEGENIFIAECKFWKGAKKFREAISQLLGYLTWRDSKSSLVLFIQNKGFSSVLEQIPDAAAEHSNFVEYDGQKNKNRFDCIFHIDGDPNREVRTAIMLYHIPDS